MRKSRYVVVWARGHKLHWFFSFQTWHSTNSLHNVTRCIRDSFASEAKTNIILCWSKCELNDGKKKRQHTQHWWCFRQLLFRPLNGTSKKIMVLFLYRIESMSVVGTQKLFILKLWQRQTYRNRLQYIHVISWNGFKWNICDTKPFALSHEKPWYVRTLRRIFGRWLPTLTPKSHFFLKMIGKICRANIHSRDVGTRMAKGLLLIGTNIMNHSQNMHIMRKQKTNRDFAIGDVCMWLKWSFVTSIQKEMEHHNLFIG